MAEEVAVSAAVPVTVEVAVSDPEDVSVCELVPVGELLLVTAAVTVAVCEGVKVALSVAVRLLVPVSVLLELDVTVSEVLSLLQGCSASAADSSQRQRRAEPRSGRLGQPGRGRRMAVRTRAALARHTGAGPAR